MFLKFDDFFSFSLHFFFFSEWFQIETVILISTFSKPTETTLFFLIIVNSIKKTIEEEEKKDEFKTPFILNSN